MTTRRLPRRPGGAIAVPFDRPPADGELDELTGMGADLFELRLDLAGCQSPDEAERLAGAFAPAPLVVTCRSAAEGGKGGADHERLLLLSVTVEHACALDIELSSTSILSQVSTVARAHGRELVVSHHDTEKTPDMEQLFDIADRIAGAGADIIKVATTVASEDDVERLARLTKRQVELGRDAAVMGMGADGFAGPSRVRLAAAGSLYVFAQAGTASAPGQPSLQWLAEKLGRD